MTEHDLDLIEFPEWSQWGEGESGRCCECLRFRSGMCSELGYCELTDEWVSRDDTCDFWRFYA